MGIENQIDELIKKGNLLPEDADRLKVHKVVIPLVVDGLAMSLDDFRKRYRRIFGSVNHEKLTRVLSRLVETGKVKKITLGEAIQTYRGISEGITVSISSDQQRAPSSNHPIYYRTEQSLEDYVQAHISKEPVEAIYRFDENSI